MGALQCNMLEGVADHKIFNVQHQVYRILENPVNHLLAALHDIQYEKNFYPEFDSQTFKLYEMLTKDKTEVFGELLGVSSSKQTHNSEYMGNVTLNNISDDSLDVNSKGKDKYQRKMTKIRLEEESKKQKENEERRRLEEEANKNSTDHWLEGDWIIDKDETRWKNIITFFLEHFLNMAEKSNTHRNHGQAYMYFQQAKNLYRRLDEEGFAGDGSKYSPLKIRLDTLENNLTDLNKRDYFNIGFSHPQLVRTASFRSEQRVSIPLPSPPSEESSPIPGTKRPDEKSLAKELENIQQKLDEKKKAKEQNTIEGLGWIKEAQNGISDSKDESSKDSVKQQVKVTIHNVETEESDDFEIYKL